MTRKTAIYLDPETLKSLKNRLTRIEGHIRGIAKMLEEKKSCDAILLQIAAVQSAMRKATAELLKGHMETCVKACALEDRDEAALDSLKDALVQALKIL